MGWEPEGQTGQAGQGQEGRLHSEIQQGKLQGQMELQERREYNIVKIIS